MESVLPIPEAMVKLNARFLSHFEIVKDEDWNFAEVPHNTILVQSLINHTSIIMKQPFDRYIDAKDFSAGLQVLGRIGLDLLEVRRVVDELYGEIYGRTTFRLYRSQLDEINQGVEKLAALGEEPLSFRYNRKINYLLRTELVLKEGERSKARIICYAKNGSSIEDTSFIDEEMISNHLATKISSQIRHIECPQTVPLEKRGPIPFEDRLWRYNYYSRVVVGVIPKRRPCDADSYAESTMYNLWEGIEQDPIPQDVEMPECSDEIKFIGGMKYIGIHAPKYRNGDWWGMHLNEKTGMFELRKMREGGKIHPLEMPEEHKQIIASTPLPPPPSQRAVGYEVKMDAKTKDRWISKCPDWMQDWALMLIKPKDESWTK